MPKSTYSANNTINVWYRATPLTAPPAVYVALYLSMPTVAGGGVEVSGGNYVRQAVTVGAPTNGTASNSIEVLFPTATADWGTLLGYGYFDALSNGNLLSFTTFGAPRQILTGDVVRLPAGMLIINET
jgi:hypothetical protein